MNQIQPHINLYKKLRIIFWVDIIILVSIIGYLMYIKGPVWGEDIETNIILERYAIIVTMVCIPLALKLFHSKTKKLEKLPKDKILNKYSEQYILRLVILNIAVAFNIVGFYLYESQNFILMAIISIFSILFCYPSKDVISDLFTSQLDNNTKSENTEDKL